MKNALVLVVGAAMLCAVTIAGAAGSYIDGSFSSGMTQVTSDFGTMSGLVWPLAMLITFTFIALKLVKRGAKKV